MQKSEQSAGGIYNPGASIVVRLGVILATGWGIGPASGGFFEVMGSVAMGSLKTQAVMSMLQNGFDPVDAGRDFFRKETFMNAAKEGVTAGALKVFGLQKPVGLDASIREIALRTGVGTTFDTISTGRFEVENLLQNAGSAVVHSLSRHVAGRIGQSYRCDNPTLNYVTHKLCHAGLGMGMGGALAAISGKDVGKGILSGGVAGVISEVVGEALIDEPEKAVGDAIMNARVEGRPLDGEGFMKSYAHDVERSIGIANLVSTGASVLAGLDGSIAMGVGENALRNNLAGAVPAAAHLLRMLMAGTVLTGMTVQETRKLLVRSSGRNDANTYGMTVASDTPQWDDEGYIIDEGKPLILITPDMREEILGRLREGNQGLIPVDRNTGMDIEYVPVYDGEQISILMKGQLPDDLPEGTWLPPEEAIDKVPDFMGMGRLNRDGKGFRWIGKHGENVVRIDRGNPLLEYPHQQVDHVRINFGGQVIGRDGIPVSKSDSIPKPKDAPESHIPLSEWVKWRDWNKK